MRFEQLTQKHTARNRHSQNSNPGLLMLCPVNYAVGQPILPVPFCPASGRWVRKEKDEETRAASSSSVHYVPHTCCQGTGGGCHSRKVKGVLIPHLSIHCLSCSWKETYLQSIPCKFCLMNLYSFLTKRQNKIPEFFLTLSLSIMVVLGLSGGWLVAESLTVMSHLLRSSFAPENSKDQDKPLPMPLNKWVSGQSLQCLIRLPLAQ